MTLNDILGGFVRPIVRSLSFAIALYGCNDTSQSCAKDTDCKGDRVCVQGECYDPGSEVKLDCVSRYETIGKICCDFPSWKNVRGGMYCGSNSGELVYDCCANPLNIKFDEFVDDPRGTPAARAACSAYEPPLGGAFDTYYKCARDACLNPNLSTVRPDIGASELEHVLNKCRADFRDSPNR